MQMRRSVLVLVLPCSAFVACLSSTSDLPTPDPQSEPYIGPRSACSTGPVYTFDTQFPAGPRESHQPECIRHCGGPYQAVTWGVSGGLSDPLEAAPSGACTAEGEACSMVAVRPCCAGSAQGTALILECRCRAGAWSCVSAAHGGVCVSCTPEAGIEAPDSGIDQDSGGGDGGDGG